MNNRPTAERIAEYARQKREDSGVSVERSTNSFAENDGDSAEGHLGLRIKKAESSDGIPSAQEAYASSNKGRGGMKGRNV